MIPTLAYHRDEIMRVWRFAVLALLSEARKKNRLNTPLSSEELIALFETQYQRPWNIFVSRARAKGYSLKHDGRYIRKLPVAEHRLTRLGADQVEYLAKDTRSKRLVPKRYSLRELVDILMLHMPRRGRHAMRYFGLLAPRCKARTWSAFFVLLGQQQRPHPPRLRWRWLIKKTFGVDPLLDSTGQPMNWMGRREAARQLSNTRKAPRLPPLPYTSVSGDSKSTSRFPPCGKRHPRPLPLRPAAPPRSALPYAPSWAFVTDCREMEFCFSYT
jgi:Putative transposase